MKYAIAMMLLLTSFGAFAILVRVFFMRDANGVLCYTGP